MRKILNFSVLMLLFACTIQPEPIEYGKDACSHCKMTIMEDKFGGEIVNDKGKIFKFDDLGCLVQYMNENQLDDSKAKFIVLNTIDQPKDLISYKDLHFVKSEKFSTPMLGNVAAFENQSMAKHYVENDSSAQVVDWNEVKSILK